VYVFSGESILNPGLLIDIGMKKKLQFLNTRKKQNNMRFGGGGGGGVRGQIKKV